MSDYEQQAQRDYERNRQAQMASEQTILDAQARETYNARLAFERQQEEERRRRGY